MQVGDIVFKEEGKWPKIKNKYYEGLYIDLELEFENGEKWKGKVITISTTGRYKLELTEKI